MATKDDSKEVVTTEEVKSPEVFSSKEELTIPWSAIKTIGEDVILVEI